MDFVIFTLAIGALIVGADFIVNQSERIALHFNISEFVIGATVIALGTSFPEVAASMAASINNKPDMALANAIGSNIFNITLVLALIFIITKNINPNRDFFAKDTTWALVPVMLFIIMSIDGHINKFDALLLLLLMSAYVLFLLNDAPELENEDIENIKEENHFNWLKTIALLVIGLILVVGGAHFTVESASDIATDFGISDRVIAIILISFGTSLPELVVSISASIKGKVDMAIGNIIGSNLANITLVIGLSALVSPNPIAIDLTIRSTIFDIATMTVATIMLIYITANKLYSKPAGISLLILLAIFIEETYQSIQ
ncbi:K+-dependent Na+/Ca+ exchanger related-protein [hydrothermal vent metagenome]|uniref:K+-dependent Na+/Ca+ exchanger related-protein n=1 Tax=hydrothermal vent metagenome TaxID=652676 RepID=A0A1W1CPB8_9ZZZZ